MSGDTLLILLALATPILLARITLAFFRLRVSGRAPVRWPTLLVGNALILCVLVLAFFFVFEVYFRYVRDVTDGDALTKGSKRWFERHWTTNALGFRDDVEYTLERSDERRRVTFFGDSFTAGHGVEVSDRFANRIREARPGWEVHAMAAPGTSTRTQLLALNRLLARAYDLDTVVLVYCFNDLDPLIPELEGVMRELLRPPPAVLAPLVDHSYLANALHYFWKVTRSPARTAGRDYFSLIEKAYEGPTWETQRALLREFHRTVESHGGRLHVVTFPVLIHLGRGEDEDHVMHPLLDAFWRGRGVPHLDLLPVLQAHKGPEIVVSRFDDHPSALAHDLAAESILEFLDASAAKH